MTVEREALARDVSAELTKIQKRSSTDSGDGVSK